MMIKKMIGLDLVGCVTENETLRIIKSNSDIL